MPEPALTDTTPWLQPRAASSQKGRKRLATILRVARELFANEGYSKFTLRQVAARADMHLASLQHYFATKEDLLGALIDDTNAYHARVLQDILDKPAGSAEQRFIFFIRHQLAEHQNFLTCGFFFQLWSLAPHYEFARILMEKMYRNYRHQLFHLMQAMRPDLAKDELEQRALLIVAMLEGMMVLIGGRKKSSAPFNNLSEKTEAAVLDIVNK